jgi:hypothetical protein
VLPPAPSSAVATIAKALAAERATEDPSEVLDPALLRSTMTPETTM